MRIISIAIKNVVRQRRRSLAALLATVCGIASLIVAGGFIEWNLWFGRESTIHSQLGHIRVFKPGYLDGGAANPFAYLLADDAQQLQFIEAQPHVNALAPRLSFNGLISHGDSTISFIGEGVSPDRENLLSRSLTIVQGEQLAQTDGTGLIIGEGLAANLGVAPGDTVVLLVTTANGGANAVEARVRGLFRTVTKAYDDSALRLPIALARQLLRASGAHSYAIVLDDTASTDAVVANLRNHFRGQPLQFVPWYELADFYNKTAALFSKQIAVLHLIIAAIIVLSISNSMMMNVLERTSEIGTSMALGSKRTGILSQFVTEGGLLGVFGGVLGIVIGYGIAWLISAVGIPMPAPPGMAFGYRAEIMVTLPIVLQAFVLAVVTTLAATLYPAWMASRMNIVDALRRYR